MATFRQHMRTAARYSLETAPNDARNTKNVTHAVTHVNINDFVADVPACHLGNILGLLHDALGSGC